MSASWPTSLAERMPQARCSRSLREVSPQMREYERFNTTIANAYIKPLMKSYLGPPQGAFELADEGAVLPDLFDALRRRNYQPRECR